MNTYTDDLVRCDIAIPQATKDAPCMYDRVKAAVAAGASIEVGSNEIPLITEIAADAIGDVRCDRIMAAMVDLSTGFLPNDARIGMLFREWLRVAVEQYAQALDKAEGRGAVIRFSNERVEL